MGYPLITLSEVAPTGGRPRVRLTQRRFFADPEAREDGKPARWLVPAVLRFRDANGIKEQSVLLREASEEIELAAEGPLAWCLANAGGRGFFRAAYAPAMLARLVAAIAELSPEERLGLVSDEWALVRAGQTEVASFLDLVSGLGGETDHVVLEEILTRLSVIEHRHVSDDDRPRLQAFIGELFAASAARLGWQSPAGVTEDDETRLRRAALLRARALLARVPGEVTEAEERFGAHIEAGAAPLDPNLLDVVVTVAARGADEARFEGVRRRVHTETDPAAKRRFLHALARVETPALVGRTVDLAMSDDVPMQDFTSYMGVLLGNRAAREQAWTLIQTRWDAVRGKADSPMLIRRLIEALSVLPERRHMEEVQAFLAAHPIDGAKQATAQTLERLRMDVALRERLAPQIGAWLSAKRQ
jgi:puromycin-sensitive aminopeptidase